MGKRSIEIEPWMIGDMLFVLHCLGVPHVIAPEQIEAEQFAAALTICTHHKYDYVVSPDSDSLLFGARHLVKRDKKKMYLYDLGALLTKYKLTQSELTKVSVALGSDFAPKTKGIGAKTVLKKIASIELSDAQKAAMAIFTKRLTLDEINNAEWHHGQMLEDGTLIDTLLDWLEHDKNFNRGRVQQRIAKVKASRPSQK